MCNLNTKKRTHFMVTLYNHFLFFSILCESFFFLSSSPSSFMPPHTLVFSIFSLFRFISNTRMNSFRVFVCFAFFCSLSWLSLLFLSLLLFYLLCSAKSRHLLNTPYLHSNEIRLSFSVNNLFRCSATIQVEKLLALCVWMCVGVRVSVCYDENEKQATDDKQIFPTLFCLFC